jgi:GDP-L-fucose synthase
MSIEIAKSKVLVTGGLGFLGHHVVEEFRRRGAKDIVLPEFPGVDLREQIAVRKLFENVKPDLVIHLAASVGGIGANQASPGTFFYDNMAMGLHLLEEARRNGTKKVIIAGTICAYPKFAPIPFREDDLWNGYPEETNAPYGIAKKALLVMAQSYRQEFGCNFVMLFPVNLYGPGDNFDLQTSHVIPAMIRKFHEAIQRGESHVTLWGDGTPTREFLYVEDAGRGFALAAERYNDPDPVNLGAGFEISMQELAEKIAQLMEFRGQIAWDASKPNGQPRRKLDTSRAKERFGFEAQVGFDEGLRRTISWYRDNQRGPQASLLP